MRSASRGAGLRFLVLLTVLVLAAPAGARAATGAGATDVRCVAAGECTAIGSFTEPGGAQPGLVLSELGGTWQRGVLPTLPGDAATNPGVSLNGLWCGRGGRQGPDCVVVGAYLDRAGNQRPLLLFERDGAWSAGQAPRLPAGATGGGGQVAELDAVWCADVRDCVAAGDDTDRSGAQQGFTVLVRAGRTGRGTPTPVPDVAAANPQVTLTALACVSLTRCTVFGIFTDTTGNQSGLVLVGQAPAWGVGEPPLPAGAAPAAQQVQLNDVACGAPGICQVAGSFIDGNGNQVPLIVTQHGDRFASFEPVLPASSPDGSNPQAGLTAIACGGPSTCSAVGTFTDGDTAQQGLLLADSAAGAAPSQALVPPAHAARNPQVSLDGIACTAPGTCTAVGSYATVDGATLPLITQQRNGTWLAATTPKLPAGSATGPAQSAGLAGIDCPAGASCTTVGTVRGPTRRAQALLGAVSPTGAVRSLAAAAPPTGPELQADVDGLATAPAGASLAALRGGRIRLHWTAPVAGRLDVRWYLGGVPVGVTATVPVPVAGPLTVPLLPTRAAAGLPAHGPVGLVSIVSFAPATPTQNGRFPVQGRRTIVLR